MNTPEGESTQAGGPGAAVTGPTIDVGRRPVRYVNFCRVTGTPEEVILDLGLQTPEGASRQDWKAPQRVTLDFYTAKRLVFALGATLAQFESTFGKIEVDVERRLAGNK